MGAIYLSMGLAKSSICTAYEPMTAIGTDMAEFFDDLETREPAAREAALFAALPAAVAGALRAPGWREHLGAIDPTTIINPEALARLPVLRKADLPEPQRRGPSRSSAQVEVVGVGALLNDGKVIADERPSTDECAMSQTSRLPRDRLVGNEALVNQPRLRLLVADNVGAPSVWTCSGFRHSLPSRRREAQLRKRCASLPLVPTADGLRGHPVSRLSHQSRVRGNCTTPVLGAV
jgi:hypothetical protein